jgi:hypothetical protein
MGVEFPTVAFAQAGMDARLKPGFEIQGIISRIEIKALGFACVLRYIY